MKTITLNLLKKNRVYFKCTDSNGYEVKLRIDKNSENLSLSTHELLVNDESVRSKYGVDVIYSVYAELKNSKILTLKHRYNMRLVERCRELGGRWDSEEKVWVFSDIVESQIEELDYLFNTNIKTVDITAKGERFGSRWSNKGMCTFAGYPLCKATGRDSGAVMCDDVALLKGGIGSGGSVKNWGSTIDDASVFRLQISENLLNSGYYDKDKWDVKIVDNQ